MSDKFIGGRNWMLLWKNRGYREDELTFFVSPTLLMESEIDNGYSCKLTRERERGRGSTEEMRKMRVA